ncbi:hypothetical protein AY601_2442 [Pedobacter cryoconitis]|uniref:DUF2490 domain-containing protein n=1 Tax=Pedobacter cryoconitis TaxID=188932 RepID=A0A127VD91_9SPHI|nr:DUF2490 domain-containing protein [Pedobacter cryoconitis]AMP99332.1 hypothetical protein AY601_2442 [Pedobacter cryoconitis]
MIRISIFLLTVLCFLGTTVIAQTNSQNSGWLFLLNNTKINEKWGTHLDVQVRSADNWSNVRNFLFRPGITYFINPQNDLTVGYLLSETHNQVDDLGEHKLVEHRIWQQYIHKHKISTVNVSHRFRLEQRFVEKVRDQDIFAQRLRYFVRFLIPLKKEAQQFEQGLFAALQNELFFNVQHKDKLSGHFFDQNRAYAALGYRFSKKFDLEAGYLNQAVKGVSTNSVNNVIQLAVYTRF